MSIPNRSQLLLEHMAHVLAEGLGRRAVAMMHQIRAYEFAERGGQVSLDLLAQRELFDRLATLQVPLLDVIMNVELERVLAEIGLHRLERGLQAHSGIQVTGQVAERHAQVEAVLGVEAGVFDKVQAAADYVAGGECWSVVLAGS